MLRGSYRVVQAIVVMLERSYPTSSQTFLSSQKSQSPRWQHDSPFFCFSFVHKAQYRGSEGEGGREGGKAFICMGSRDRAFPPRCNFPMTAEQFFPHGQRGRMQRTAVVGSAPCAHIKVDSNREGGDGHSIGEIKVTPLLPSALNFELL